MDMAESAKFGNRLDSMPAKKFNGPGWKLASAETGFLVAFWCIADVIVNSLAVMEVRSRLPNLAFLQFFDVSFDFVFKSYELLYC